MSNGPRHTPGPHDLFMALWSQRMLQEHGVKPGQTGWGPAQVVHWAKVWVDCADMATRLAEMEEKAAEQERNTPEPWTPPTDREGMRQMMLSVFTLWHQGNITANDAIETVLKVNGAPPATETV